MFAKFPYTPSDTPVPQPRRRIRCKMCRYVSLVRGSLRNDSLSFRQELAAREHMLDHGQLGPPTPAVLSAAPSRRPSMNDPKPLSPLASGATAPRRASSSGGVKPLVQGPPAAPSSGLSRRPSIHDPPSRSRLGSINELSENRPVQATLLQLDTTSATIGRSASDLLSESAFDEDSSDEEPPKSESESESDAKTKASAPPELKAGPNGSSGAEPPPTEKVDADLPPTEAAAEIVDKVPPLPSQRPALSLSNSYAHPTDLAAQLAAHPKLAALRSPAGLSMTPLTSAGGISPTRSTPQSPGITSVKGPNYFAPASPPILANPKCSGYFVEPVSTR